MAIETIYSAARAHLAEYFDRVAKNRETVIVKRRGAEAVAIIAADELASLQETVHLLRSPRNAERLFAALARARQGSEPLASLEKLRREAEPPAE